MAAIHKRRLRNGRIAWELTHGRGPNRIRMVVGHSKAEAEAALRMFNEQLLLHGRALFERRLPRQCQPTAGIWRRTVDPPPPLVTAACSERSSTAISSTSTRKSSYFVT